MSAITGPAGSARRLRSAAGLSVNSAIGHLLRRSRFGDEGEVPGQEKVLDLGREVDVDLVARSMPENA
jgi:hypothetical protein